MSKRIDAGLMTIVLGCALVQSGFAGQQPQRGQRGGRGGNQQEQPAAPPARPMPQSQEEATAFNAVQADTNLATRAAAAATFIATYPSSQLLGFAYRIQAEAYSRLGKSQELIAAAEKGVEVEAVWIESLKAGPGGKTPEGEQQLAEFPKVQLFYMQQLMNAYQTINDAAKALEWGEKALNLDPNDTMTLLTVPRLMAERPPQDEKERERQMKRAEDLGKQAAAGVKALMESPMAMQIPAEQKAGIQADVHQTMGLIYLNLKKFSDSQKEYLLSIEQKNDDPVAYFRLGLAFAQDKKIDEAIDSLAKSVFLKGITESQAREILQQIYQAKNKSLDGLDKLIADAGARIGAK